MPTDLLAQSEPQDLLPHQKDSVSPTRNLAREFNQKHGISPFFGVPEGYNALAHGIDQGGAMGFGDEATAAGAATVAKLNALLSDKEVDWGQAYDEALAARRGQMKSYVTEHPKTALGAELAGGLASVGGLVKSGVTTLKSAKTLPTVLKSGREGLLYGGIAGAGHAEGDLVDRGAGTITGAATGAAMAGAFPLVLSGGSTLGRLVKDKVKTNFGNPESQVNARLNQAMQQTGITADDVQLKLDELGSEAGIIDTLGQPGYALARSASNTSPAARETLEGMSDTRMAGQPDRLNTALGNAANLNQPYSSSELRQFVRDAAKPEIDQAYNAARQAGYDLDMTQFDDIFQSQMAQNALSEGKRLARERLIAEGGSVDTMPSTLAILDETKKSLDAMAQPKLGHPPTNQQAIAARLAETLRTRIDDTLPEYANARGLAKRLYQQERAVDLGEQLVKSHTGDVVRRIESLSPNDRPFVGQGFAAKKMAQVNNRRTTPGAVDSLFGSKNQQEAIKTALGDGAQTVQKQLAAERLFAKTQRALTGNSTTARQLAEMGVTGGAGAGLGFMVGEDAQSASMGALATLLARKGGGSAVRALTAKKEAQIAKLLAEKLAGRELPTGVGEEVNKNPALQNLIMRVLSLQSGGYTGEAVTATP